jgi:hypothetical protein
LQPVAEHPQQRHGGIRIDAVRAPIDGQGEYWHDLNLVAPGARRYGVAMKCARVAAKWLASPANWRFVLFGCR